MNLIDVLLNPNSIYFWVLIISIIIGAVVIISRPFSTYIKFVYTNAKYEAIGNPYVSEKNLNGIVESKNLTNFKESLNQSKDYQLTGDKAIEIQDSLEKSFYLTIEMMKKDSSKKMNDFFNIYLEKNDLYIVKKVIKDKILDISINEKILEKVLLDNSKELIERLISAEFENLSKILTDFNFPNELIQSIKDKNFLKIDSSIDRYIISKFKSVKVPYKCEIGKQKFIKILIDVLNIKNVLRGKQLNYEEYFFKDVYLGEGYEIASWKYKELYEFESVSQVITSLEGTSYYNKLKDSIEEYNKTNSVQIFENVLDSIFLKLIKDISMQNYVTIGPTIRYITSKEYEIRNLKVIAKGIEENLSSEIINNQLIKEAL